MKIKFLLLILIISIAAPQISAKACGGEIECECGDTVVEGYKLNKSLVCKGDGLYLKNSIDCQGYDITGTSKGIGLNILGIDNVKIRNCHISNFSIGIKLDIRKVKYTNVHYYIYQSNYAKIFNNVIENNNYGIFTIDTVGDEIYNNFFRDNSEYGLYLTSVSGKYWNNKFYEKGIFYKDSKSKSFCEDNISNVYFENATGPLCNCHIHIPGSTINSKVDLCAGEYRLSDSIKMGDSGKLDCNGATLIGNGDGTGILVEGAKNTLIKDCEIKNFKIGVQYKTWPKKVGYYTYYIGSFNNELSNSKIYDVDYGIHMSSPEYDSRAEQIHNNTIIGREYNIYNNIDVGVNAKENWWGTNNLTKIENKFLKSSYVQYEPFIKKDIEMDLKIDEVKIINNSIHIKISKNLYEPVDNFKLKLIFVDGNISRVENLLISEEFGYEIYKKIKLNEKFDEIHVFVDSENDIGEIDEKNNYLKYIHHDNIFINVETGVDIANIEIFNYIKENFINMNIVEDPSYADHILNIGLTRRNHKSFFSKPYEFNIISSYNGNVRIINVSGEDIEGELLGIKHIALNKETYFGNDFSYSSGQNFEEGIRIYDYLHNIENLKYYKTNTNKFAEIINSALNDKIYSFNIKTISINDMKYNLKKFNPKSTKKFKDFVNKRGYPLVFAGGLWSNIDSWKIAAEKFANRGYDVYLIELTGGEEIECGNCSDYTYEYLIENVYPTYIDFILNDSNQSKIRYIGHSNGARTALDSISSNPEYNEKIETLIAVGVPGAFEEYTLFSYILNESGNISIQRLREKNKTHITMGEVAHELDSSTGELLYFFNQFSHNNKISLNLFSEYFNWISSNKDEQPGINVRTDNFALIYGNYFWRGNDWIVPIEDELQIYNKVESENKYKRELFASHLGMTNNDKINKEIFKILKKEVYSDE